MTSPMELDRSHLIEVGLRQGILVLAAPTGFGKTRLMTQHKAHRERALVELGTLRQHGREAVSEATNKRPGQDCLWIDGGAPMFEVLHRFLAALKPLSDTIQPCIYIDNWQAISADMRQRVLSAVCGAPVDLVIATRDPCDAQLLPGADVVLGRILTARHLRLNFSDVEHLFNGKLSISNSRLFRETLGWPLALGLINQDFTSGDKLLADIVHSETLVDALAADIHLQSALWQALSEVLSWADWQRLLTLTLFPSLERSWFDSFEQGAIDELLHRYLSGLFLEMEGQLTLLPIVRKALVHLGFRYFESDYRQVHLQLAQRRSEAGDIAAGISLMLSCGERSSAARLLSEHGGLLEWIRHGLGNLEQILALFDDRDIKAFPEVAWLYVIVNFKRGRVDQARRMVNRYWRDQDAFEWNLADALIRLYEGRILDRQELDSLRCASLDQGSEPYATALANNILALVALQQGELQTASKCLDSARVAYNRELEAEYGETYLDIHQAHLALLNMQGELAGALLTRVAGQVQTYFSQDLSIRIALQGVKRELAFCQGLLPPVNAIGQLVYKLNRSEAWFDLYASIYTLAARSAMHHDGPQELLVWLAKASQDSQKRRLAYLDTLLSYLARLALLRWPERESSFQPYIKPVAEQPLSMPWRLQQLHLEWCDLTGQASDLLCLTIAERAQAGAHLYLYTYCQWLIALRNHDRPALAALWQQLDEQGWVGMVWLVKHRLSAEELSDCLNRHNRTRLLQQPAAGADTSLLSGREVSVIELVRQGHRNKQIALELDISEQTVKFHLKNIFRKLGVKGRRQAVAVLSAGLPNFQ